MAAQLRYHVDVVLVIDATASMTPILGTVKGSALMFHDRMGAALADSGKHVDALRLRVVLFRDLRDNGSLSLAASGFFALPQQSAEFSGWVSGIVPIANTTDEESGLAGLSVALHSPWTNDGDRRRHVVVLWTDNPPHLPEHEFAYVPPASTAEVAPSFDGLTDMWESSQFVPLSSRRLVLFAPEMGLWPTIAAMWSNVVHYPSRAGLGLSDHTFGEILSAIVNSI